MADPAFQFIVTVVKRDWRFLAAILSTCGIAAIVAAFQYAVYASFGRTGAIAPRMLHADFWVTASSVECFDFPSPFNEDYAALLARYVPEAKFRRVVFGFATWRSPAGNRGNVAVIGVDDAGVPDTGFIVDRSDLARLDLLAPSRSIGKVQFASISDTTLMPTNVTTALPTFLGAPYVVLSFDRARELLGLDSASTSYLVGNFIGPMQNLAAIKRQASQKFPDVAILSSREFEKSSSLYWERKTGAGAAILLAAVLASVLMAFLLLNGLSRFIQRYHTDLISILGHGASERDISKIVGGIGVIVATITLLLMLALTPLILFASKPLLPWATYQFSDMLIPTLAVSGALLIALYVSRKAVKSYDPELVFRS